MKPDFEFIRRERDARKQRQRKVSWEIVAIVAVYVFSIFMAVRAWLSL